MPTGQPRYDICVVPEGDRTSENAVECGAITLDCADCVAIQQAVKNTRTCARSVKNLCVTTVRMSTLA